MSEEIATNIKIIIRESDRFCVDFRCGNHFVGPSPQVVLRKYFVDPTDGAYNMFYYINMGLLERDKRRGKEDAVSWSVVNKRPSVITFSISSTEAQWSFAVSAVGAAGGSARGVEGSERGSVGRDVLEPTHESFTFFCHKLDEKMSS